MDNILNYLENTTEKHFDKCAVDDGSEKLTWGELTAKAQKIGTGLAGLVPHGKPVVILMEKSATMLTSMFGSLYAGGFYVTVDPDQPADRIKLILSVLEPEVVITTQESVQRLREAGFKKNVFMPDEDTPDCADSEKLAEIRSISGEKDILYGMFTSGSTGVPKGIAVSHRAAIDFICHFVEEFGIDADDIIGNQAPFDFDVSVKDIYSAVVTGATLVLIPKRLFSIPPELLDYICDKKVTNMTWAVSALTLVSSLKGLKYRIPKDVRRIMFSGEVMPVKQLRLWQEALPKTRFVNLYGPTEITCNCTAYEVTRTFADGEKLPIGKALPGRDVFLLDEKDMEVTKPGEVGEICVAGESISEGYYNNTEETDKRFIRGRGSRELFYRTGDLGYFAEDGNLYFSGRKDFQIKHMGHRIELEEIEHALNQIDGIERSCCIMDTKRNRLIAYYLGDIDPKEIKENMQKSVPAYMIPHRLNKVEKMELNKNGKTDRNYYRNLVEGK